MARDLIAELNAQKQTQPGRDLVALLKPKQEREMSLLQRADQALLSNPVGRGLAEFASAANRSIMGAADFFGPDTANAVLELAGSDKRVLTIEGAFGSPGGYMQPGLARDVVQAAGQVAPMAVATGQVLRSAAGALPAATAGESAAAGTLRQMGQSTVAQDAVAGAAAGAGGAIGKEVGGETGEMVGSVLGAMAAPIPGMIKTATQNAAARKAVTQSAPTIDMLKGEARKIYKQIDDLGATIDQKYVGNLAQNIQQTIKREGFNARIHPKVSAALDEVASSADKPLTITELDTLRRVANSAAKSLEPDESRLGNMMVEKIDDFLNALPEDALTNASGKGVSSMYREARGYWARARKAELLERAVEKAKDQASGFENGLRVQFRSLLNNQKLMRGFSAEEKEALRRVVRGGPAENILRALGKFGFTEGQASSMLLGSLGGAGGYALGGAAGGVAVPLTGQMAKSLAQRLTRNNASLASELVRAGPSGREIAYAYVRNVPKNKQSAEELAGLMLQQGAKLADVSKVSNRIVSEAALIAELLGKSEPVEQPVDEKL